MIDIVLVAVVGFALGGFLGSRWGIHKERKRLFNEVEKLFIRKLENMGRKKNE